MNLLSIRKNVKRTLNNWQKLLTTVEKQGEFHDIQKAGILELTMYPGYLTIVQYREAEAENAMQLISNPKTPQADLDFLRAKYSLAVGFLDFLDDATQ